jgi:hypothetical protein
VTGNLRFDVRGLIENGTRISDWGSRCDSRR